MKGIGYGLSQVTIPLPAGIEGTQEWPGMILVDSRPAELPDTKQECSVCGCVGVYISVISINR
jgi:hypothetical protein